MSIKKEEVERLATPLIRKYDWYTIPTDNGVRLYIHDGVKRASVEITTGEDIESEINRLLEEVDGHRYGEI